MRVFLIDEKRERLAGIGKRFPIGPGLKSNECYLRYTNRGMKNLEGKYINVQV